VKHLWALYGCIESHKLWFKDLREELVKMWFTLNKKDHCVFNVIRAVHKMSVCIYVDDLFTTSIDESDLEWLRSILEETDKEVTYTNGMKHHGGQTFDFSVSGEWKVFMPEYITDALGEYEVSGHLFTPAHKSLFIYSSSTMSHHC
jgi:hypothetical protein